MLLFIPIFCINAHDLLLMRGCVWMGLDAWIYVCVCVCICVCVCVSIVLPSTPSTLPGLTDGKNSSPSNHADEKLQFTLHGEVK